MKRLLVATDLSARSDRALDRAVALARSSGAHLTVLHVADENLPCKALGTVLAAAEADIRSCLAKLGRDCPADTAVRVVAGNDYRQILEAADRDAYDLIVLGRHRNETSDVGVDGTTLGRVVRMGDRPVLVVSGRTEGPYRKVLLGVDFSDFSRSALRAALEIAPEAELHLVHAFEVPFEGFLPGWETRNEVRDEHDRAFAQLVEEAAGPLVAARSGCRTGKPKIRKILRQGEPAGVLRKEACRIAPDLLAVGTHGRAGLARAILGSVAQDLLDRPPCDVLVVRSTAGSPRD